MVILEDDLHWLEFRYPLITCRGAPSRWQMIATGGEEWSCHLWKNSPLVSGLLGATGDFLFEQASFAGLSLVFLPSIWSGWCPRIATCFLLNCFLPYFVLWWQISWLTVGYPKGQTVPWTPKRGAKRGANSGENSAQGRMLGWDKSGNHQMGLLWTITIGYYRIVMDYILWVCFGLWLDHVWHILILLQPGFWEISGCCCCKHIIPW